MKIIEISDHLADYYVDIMLYYSKDIPNYLNHRAFFNLVRLLTSKPNVKENVEKCLRIFKIIFNSEERSDDDILIEGSPIMYEQVLSHNLSFKDDILYIIGLHSIKSPKFKRHLRTMHEKTKTHLFNTVERLAHT